MYMNFKVFTLSCHRACGDHRDSICPKWNRKQKRKQHVIQIGWVLADSAGDELCSYEQMWLLPRGVAIDAYVASMSHKITTTH